MVVSAGDCNVYQILGPGTRKQSDAQLVAYPLFWLCKPITKVVYCFKKFRRTYQLLQKRNTCKVYWPYLYFNPIILFMWLDWKFICVSKCHKSNFGAFDLNTIFHMPRIFGRSFDLRLETGNPNEEMVTFWTIKTLDSKIRANTLVYSYRSPSLLSDGFLILM